MQTLGIPKSDLQVMQGAKNRDKTIGISTTIFRQKLRLGDEDIVASVREKLLSK